MGFSWFLQALLLGLDQTGACPLLSSCSRVTVKETGAPALSLVPGSPG